MAFVIFLLTIHYIVKTKSKSLTSQKTGSGYALLALIIHEDNDRCHYYQGRWNRGDLVRGILSISIGALVRYYIYNKVE